MNAREHGFSLTEMMVAITIGLILLAGATSMLVTSKQNYVVQDDLARIQENARFAMDQLLRDVRMAGFFGCHDSMANVTNDINLAALVDNLADTTRALEGFEDNTNAWAPTNEQDDFYVTSLGGANEGDGIAGSDAITVRHAAGFAWPVVAAMGTTLDPITIDHQPINGVTLSTGDVAVIYDCRGADVFTVTNTPAVGNGVSVQHAAGVGNQVRNATAALSKRYDTQARIAPLVAIRYYVGAVPCGEPQPCPALFRRHIVNGNLVNERLVDGVESLQITYGVDTTGDNLPDAYVRASDPQLGMAPGNWNSVVSVRVGMLIRSTNEVGSDVYSQANVVVNGETLFAGAPPNDRRRRRALVSTVAVRNDTQ